MERSRLSQLHQQESCGRKGAMMENRLENNILLIVISVPTQLWRNRPPTRQTEKHRHGLAAERPRHRHSSRLVEADTPVTPIVALWPDLKGGLLAAPIVDTGRRSALPARVGRVRLTPASLALTSELVDDFEHFLPPCAGIDRSLTQRHTDFCICAGLEQAFEEEMAHVETDIDTAVAGVVLDRRVVQVDKFEGFVDEFCQFLSREVGFVVISWRHAVVVEGNPVDDRD
jgi:hypothetical protein